MKAPAQSSANSMQLRTPPPDKSKTLRLPIKDVSPAKPTLSKASEQAATHAKGAPTRSSLVKPRKDAQRGAQEEVTKVPKRYGVQFSRKDREKKANLGDSAIRTRSSVLVKGADGPADTVVAAKPDKSATFTTPLKASTIATDEDPELFSATYSVSPTTCRSSVTKSSEEATPALDLLTELRLALATQNLLKAQQPAGPPENIEEPPARKLIEKINGIKLERALADVINRRKAYEDICCLLLLLGLRAPV